MNINSEYIQKKEFHTVFKGYNMEEVDKFLDILAVEFDRLTKANKELQDTLDRMKFENPSQDEDVTKLVSDVLISAHKIADEIKRKAEIDAKTLIEQKKDSEELEIKSLIERKQQISEQTEKLSDIYMDFITKVKNYLNDFSIKVGEMERNIQAEYEISQPGSEKETVIEEKINLKDGGTMGKKENPVDDSIKEKEKEIVLEEDKKIRDFIESDGYRSYEGSGQARSSEDLNETREEKKIFDEFEDEKIGKDKKKMDIANSEIIDEFFGDNEERKY
jgi:cell division initiation protein